MGENRAMSDAELLEFCLCLERTTSGVVCGPDGPVSPSYREANHEPRIAVPHGFDVVSVPEPDPFTTVLVGIAVMVAAVIGREGGR